jgi:hypothetical protein
MAVKKSEATNINLTFEFEKDTKNTYRYKEAGLDNVIGTIYIAKRVLGSTPPEKLSISITV